MFELQEIMNDILRYGNRSPRTIKTYGTYTTAFLEYCVLRDIDPLQIPPDEIRIFLDNLQLSRGLADTTINNATSQIKYLLLVNGYPYWDDRLIPFKKVYQKAPFVPTREMVEQLINSIDDEHIKEKTMATLMYSSGMRVSECCELNCKDIYKSTWQIRVNHGKGNKERWVILAPQAYDLIVKYWTGLPQRMRSRDWLFTQQTNIANPCDKELVETFLHNHCKNVGLPNITPRVLRRAYATHSIMDGVDIHDLQALMGHKSVDTTMIYIFYADVFRARTVPSPLNKMRLHI